MRSTIERIQGKDANCAEAKHEYVELRCKSAFSFLEGVSHPEALAERAAALGYSALALSDRDGLYAAPRFHQAARSVGLRPITGAELTTIEPQGAYHLQALVESAEGYANLARLISLGRHRAPKGFSQIYWGA